VGFCALQHGGHMLCTVSRLHLLRPTTALDLCFGHPLTLACYTVPRIVSAAPSTSRCVVSLTALVVYRIPHVPAGVCAAVHAACGAPGGSPPPAPPWRQRQPAPPLTHAPAPRPGGKPHAAICCVCLNLMRGSSCPCACVVLWPPLTHAPAPGPGGEPQAAICYDFVLL
jgi:hypothetical protein